MWQNISLTVTLNLLNIYCVLIFLLYVFFHFYIKINIKFNDNTLEIEVKDSGIGIPEESLEAIFNTFEQAKGQKNTYGGTGLGLPISKKIIEQ